MGRRRSVLGLPITSGYAQQNRGKMNRVSISYAIYWELDFAPEYKWTKCGKCFNSQTGKQIKQVYKNRCIGYNIRSKFVSLTRLREHLKKIEKEHIPF